MGSSTSLPKANTTFSLALFKKLSDDKTTNIFSPFSISSAMAMVMLGARGNTAIQMSESLKFQDCQDDVHTSFGQLLSRLKKPGASIALNAANRVYGEKSYTFKETDTKPVMMMEKTTYFPLAFIPEVNCKILEMPYKGKKLSMLIFLPEVIEDDTTGLEKLEKQPTYETFVEWTHPDRMKNIEIDVSLPQFKMEETYDLEDILTSMGMVDAFDVTKSDFSGVSETKELVLSKVTHKAFVEVNEEGTEAAAGSGSYMLAMCARLYPRFTADHPFLFFIRHHSSMSTLFAGRFCSL